MKAIHNKPLYQNNSKSNNIYFASYLRKIITESLFWNSEHQVLSNFSSLYKNKCTCTYSIKPNPFQPVWKSKRWYSYKTNKVWLIQNNVLKVNASMIHMLLLQVFKRIGLNCTKGKVVSFEKVYALCVLCMWGTSTLIFICVLKWSIPLIILKHAAKLFWIWTINTNSLKMDGKVITHLIAYKH